MVLRQLLCPKSFGMLLGMNQRLMSTANKIAGCKFMNIREGTVELRFRDTMDYGLYALTQGYIREGALEAVRLAIIRAAKTKEIIQIPADFPITKKPEGTRMGKGKGKTAYYVAKVKPGEWLFEFNCEDEMFAKEAWRQANFKLPIRIYLRKKPQKPRRKLSFEELDQMISESSEEFKQHQF